MDGSNWRRPASLEAFGGAVREARGRAGMTMEELARRTGISKPYISNIETGRAPGPASAEKLRAIARVLGLPAEKVLAGADWLRTPLSVRRRLAESEVRTGSGDVPRRGDGSINLDMLIDGRGEEEKRRLGEKETGRGGAGRKRGEGGDAAGKTADGGVGTTLPLRNVPVINRVAAGSAKEFTDLSYPAGVADGYVAAPDLPEAPVSAAFAVRVTGDSMMPEYREGDLVIVGPAEAKDGDDCVVRLGELEQFATTFKRMFFERDGKGEAVAVRLVPLNPAHEERRVMLEEVTGIYPLVYRLVPGRAAQGKPMKESGRKASEKLLGE